MCKIFKSLYYQIYSQKLVFVQMLWKLIYYFKNLLCYLWIFLQQFMISIQQLNCLLIFFVCMYLNINSKVIIIILPEILKHICAVLLFCETCQHPVCKGPSINDVTHFLRFFTPRSPLSPILLNRLMK